MSTMHDLASKISHNSSLLPAALSSDTNGAAVDTTDSHGVEAVAHIGASGITLSGTDKIEMELEESDDNSTWNDVANADISAPATGATNTGCFAVLNAPSAASKIYKTNYLGSKKYVRVVANFSGTHGSATLIAAHVNLLATALPAT